MQKWEYCQLVVNRASPSNPKSKQLVFLSVDDLSIRQIRSISQTIAKLGIDGWELVSHTQSQTVLKDGVSGFPWTEFFTFKRPLE